MELQDEEKELVAVGISVAAGCKPCTAYHLKAARQTRTEEESILAAVHFGIAVRKRAAVILEAYALGTEVEADQGSDLTRLQVLTGLGAATAVNSTDEVTHYLEEARKLGVPDIDIRSVTKLATFIRGKAISHVEKLVEPF